MANNNIESQINKKNLSAVGGQVFLIYLTFNVSN